MVQVGAPSKAYGSNYSRGRAQYERSNPQPTSTDQVNAIIKQAPELTAGQVLDIARATGAVQAPSSGTKPQGTIVKTSTGITYTPDQVQTTNNLPSSTPQGPLQPGTHFGEGGGTYQSIQGPVQPGQTVKTESTMQYRPEQNLYSITPGGNKYAAVDIAEASPGYSLAFWNHPVETTKSYIQLKLGKINQPEFQNRLYNMEVKDITSGKTFGSEGTFKVQRENSVIDNYFGVRSASPVVRIAETGALFTGIGFAAGGLTTGAATISPLLGKVTTIGLLGTGVVGLGLSGVSAYKEIKAEPTRAGKQEIFGEKISSLIIGGAGFAAGSGAFTATQGIIASRGRAEVKFSKVTKPEVVSGKELFPTIPKEAQLKAFQTGSYKGYSIPREISSGQQGGFHTTPFRFYGTKSTSTITPKSGTSELEGLYVSPYVSPAFSKTGGSGYTLFPKLSSILSPSGKPGIAFLKSKGFRESSFGYQETPVFAGQKSVNGKFAFFKQPAKEGFIDVPKMKTEAEGIARVDAGSYIFQSGKYYTKINGVRTPIDVFTTSGGKTSGTSLKVSSSARGGYNLPQEQSLYYPTSSSLFSIPSQVSSLSKSPSSKQSSSSSPTSSSVKSYSISISSVKSYYPSSRVSVTSISSITPPITSSGGYSKSITSIPISSLTSKGSSPSYSPYNVPSYNLPSFPKMGLDFGFGARKVGAKARRKYTPSYGALILGIKGKAPTGTYKGGLRPITKGFKWSFN